MSVAEGVETKEQLDFKNAGCHWVQGFIFKPVPVSEFLKIDIDTLINVLV